MNQEFYQELCGHIPQEAILLQEPMKRHTTFKIGGPADYYLAPDRQQMVDALAIAKKHNVPVTIIGNGSNLLVRDGGIRGLVMEIGRPMSEVTVDGTKIHVGAGAMLGRIANMAADAGLGGFEFAGGIPGTFGGAVVMNAGAYGGEMKDVLTSVEVLTPEGDFLTVAAEELDLSYRHSCIPKRGYIVVGGTLQLEPGDRDEIRSVMAGWRDSRLEKQPLEYPSAGSTFKRPEGYYAGKLIMDAGLRGYRVGDAQVAEKHCGFVINRQDATAAEVLQLMEDVRERVMDKFGVELEPEVKIIGE